MKSILFLFALVFVVQAQDEVKEPGALVTARNAYQKELAKANGPADADLITNNYLQALLKMQDDFGTTAASDDAKLVKREVDAVVKAWLDKQTPQDKQAEAAMKPAANWLYLGGRKVGGHYQKTFGLRLYAEHTIDPEKKGGAGGVWLVQAGELVVIFPAVRWTCKPKQAMSLDGTATYPGGRTEEFSLVRHK